MAKFFMTPEGLYYEGEQFGEDHFAVPQRPDWTHDWNGSAWVINSTRANAAHNAPILDQLAVIDAKSVRALREGDAARIAALETDAAALRAQLAQ